MYPFAPQSEFVSQAMLTLWHWPLLHVWLAVQSVINWSFVELEQLAEAVPGLLQVYDL